jgi:acylphosphatase
MIHCRILPVLMTLLVAGGVPAADAPKKEPAETAGRLVYYSGRVQGVGFRATAAQLARGYPVTGWVKNLADGRVQLVVEGPEKDVEKFLDAIRKRWGKNIEKEQREEQEPTGEYRGFTVRR